jgi:MscS family membrane protein
VKQLPYREQGPRVSEGLYEAYVSVYQRGSSELADTSSPRGTLSLFLNSMNELYSAVCVKKTVKRGDPEAKAIASRAASCLDVSELTGYSFYGTGVEALICIKEVLDRVPLPPPEAVPGLEDVQAGSGGERLARWQVPRTQITITRVQDGPRRGEYLFSPDTVKRAPQFFEEIRGRPYRTDGREVSKGLYDFWLSTPHNPAVARLVDQLPDWSENRRLGLALWQWAGLVFAVLISLGLMFAAYRIGRTRGERFRQTNLLRYCMTLIFPLVAMLVPLAFKYVAWEYLTIRSDAGHVVFFTADVIFLLALIVLLLGMSSRIAEAIIAMPRIHAQGLDAQFTRIICRAIGIVAAVIVFLEGGRHLGFPITTLLAGAGIGGLAVALAAQSLIRGLFGTVTILFDKPYQSGERIIVKGYDGVVEEIGMHATKIRLLTGHLVSIPNDHMADSEIENVGRRPHIRRTAVIEMPSDTPTAKVKRALEIVRAALKDHEGVQEDFPPRVFLRDLKESSIGIFMIYWYHPPNYWDFLAFSEKVNLQIMEQFEAESIPFAAPALTVHTADDRCLEPDSGKSTRNDGQEAG